MKILLCITGASGVIYGKRLYERMDTLSEKFGLDVKVVVSSSAEKIAEYEGVELPESDYSEDDITAPVASGSNPPDVMIVAPCSIKTLGKIANGISDNLITRAAEVCLKERKKLVLVVRETPLSYIAIENMRKVTLAGGIILPASPGFYHNPKTVDNLIDYVVDKVLFISGMDYESRIRWEGDTQ